MVLNVNGIEFLKRERGEGGVQERERSNRDEDKSRDEGWRNEAEKVFGGN